MPRPLPSLFWLLPLLVVGAGAAISVGALLSRGPEVRISFATGEGLQPGKTRVRYRNVDVGTLEELHLAQDRSHVTAVVRLVPNRPQFSMCDARFWVVRPRVGAAGVSGLGTFLSGAYIAVDIGQVSRRCKDYLGLESPPTVTSDQEGKRYMLHTSSLGSLNAGSPVYFHRLQVGQVLDYSLAKGGNEVNVSVFVRAPFDGYVRTTSRWWHASGVDLKLDSGGFRLDTQSLAAVVNGGVVFDGLEGKTNGQEASDGTGFELAQTRTDAMKNRDDGPPAALRLRFNESLRGLAIGAPVDFHGVDLGNVTQIELEPSRTADHVDMLVTINLYPYRLGPRYRSAVGNSDGEAGKRLLKEMVAQGLRGQLRVGSLLTGQRYVALDFFPNARAVHLDMKRLPIELPTVPNAIEDLQDQVAGIVDKLDQVPFDQLGTNLNKTLKDANSLFEEVNNELVPQARSTLQTAQETFNAASATLQQDSPLQSDVQQAMAQLRRTLASINALTDYLEQHPESLVWGKPSNP
jgi:paraquat-inducible protein B